MQLRANCVLCFINSSVQFGVELQRKSHAHKPLKRVESAATGILEYSWRSKRYLISSVLKRSYVCDMAGGTTGGAGGCLVGSVGRRFCQCCMDSGDVLQFTVRIYADPCIWSSCITRAAGRSLAGGFTTAQKKSRKRLPKCCCLDVYVAASHVSGSAAAACVARTGTDLGMCCLLLLACPAMWHGLAAYCTQRRA